MQLTRVLHGQGFGSRRECDALVLAGRVHIAGKTAGDPHAEVATEGLVFTVDGVDWRWCEKALVMLNKPAGVECSRDPRGGHRSVLGLLPPPLRVRGVQPVGRLDADTTGLLLLTDDGALNHRLTHPRRHVAKVYEVGTRHPVDDGQVARLSAGVVLHDDPAPVRALHCVATGSHALRLTIAEGRYHQVKRMVAAAGNRVETLHRSAFGPWILPPDLAPGQWRWLDAAAAAEPTTGATRPRTTAPAPHRAAAA